MGQAGLEEETVELVRDLIRIESINSGDPATISDGQARVADMFADQDVLRNTTHRRGYVRDAVAGRPRRSRLRRSAGTGRDRYR